MKNSLFVLTSLVLTVASAAFAQAPVLAGVGNAGDYSLTAAPGGLISLFGTDLATGTAVATVPLPNSLLGSSVQVLDGANTQDLPLWFVSAGQINAQLPYTITSSTVQVRVTTSGGTSAVLPVNILPRAPRFLTITEDGLGRPVVTKSDYSVVNRANAIHPGDYGLIFGIGLGAVTPAIVAGATPGDGAAGTPLNLVTDPVTVTLNGTSFTPTWVGLAPGLAGVYQTNFRMPYFNFAGDVNLGITTGGDSTQTNVVTAVEPNGFYWVLSGSLMPNGQTRNGVSGSGSALALRQNNLDLWGTEGYRVWTETTNLNFPTLSGVALTIRNGSTVVYDNNGIDTAAPAVVSYYKNTSGPDNAAAGLNVMYSNSNNSDAVWAGYFKLTQSTTFTSISGYFDCNGNSELPFDAANPYNTYRMNIWSDSSGAPRQTSNFVGDVWTTDTTTGTWAWATTTVSRTFADGATDPICSLTYTPAQPQTLAAGEYWFSHDVAVPAVAFPATPASVVKRQISAVKFTIPLPDSLIRVAR
jgi:uncharacterized protein (TIGR03437 family)